MHPTPSSSPGVSHPHTLGVRPVASGTWTVVPEASRAAFTVRDKLFATVHGTFPVRAGTVVTDTHGAVVRARMELEVAGVTTGNARRDRDLRKPHLLDAAAHPTVVVEADRVTPSEAGWTVEARLTARGASSPLELRVTPSGADDRQVQVRVTGRLDRSGLGMRVPTVVIGRHVEIDVDALFRRA
ncbi:MAG TPA: YceI family protein [Dermatophilaceae bacterium]|nr:YceI family protein [Dermatophilaceae bacterium]